MAVNIQRPIALGFALTALGLCLASLFTDGTVSVVLGITGTVFVAVVVVVLVGPRRWREQLRLLPAEQSDRPQRVRVVRPAKGAPKRPEPPRRRRGRHRR